MNPSDKAFSAAVEAHVQALRATPSVFPEVTTSEVLSSEAASPLVSQVVAGAGYGTPDYLQSPAYSQALAGSASAQGLNQAWSDVVANLAPGINRELPAEVIGNCLPKWKV